MSATTIDRPAAEAVAGWRAGFAGRLAISPEEFADAAGVGRTLVYESLLRGDIPAKKLGRRWLIPVAAVEAWLAGDARRDGGA